MPVIINATDWKHTAPTTFEMAHGQKQVILTEIPCSTDLKLYSAQLDQQTPSGYLTQLLETRFVLHLISLNNVFL